MQYVNDDMDELFRQAAKDYPLDTNNADWNKIAAALQSAEEGPVPAKTGNRQLLWLLLLLPFGLICNRLYTPGTILKMNDGGAAGDRSVSVPAGKNAAGTAYPVSNGEKTINADVLLLQTPPSGTVSFQSPQNFSARTDGANALDIRRPGLQNTSSPYALEDDITGGSLFTASISVPGLPIHINGYTGSGLKLQDLELAATPSEAERQRPKKEKKFYAGLMAGVDATTIKFQKIENKGYDFGMVLGYQLNRRWSIETGVFADRKFYYTEGKYFNTFKVYVPPNSKITDVSGNCTMIEWPLNVRYNITAAKKSTWFAALGTSSYFMKEEDYHYTYYYNSSNTSSVYYKEYRNSPKALFAVANLSGGYTRSMGKIADLRIEPYLKIPVTGMGVGKLPLFSAGLHVGLTKKF